MAVIIENEFDDVLLRIAAHLKALRKGRGLTQKALGERADVTGSYISDIENGLVNPTVIVLFKITKALGVRIEELLRDVSP